MRITRVVTTVVEVVEDPPVPALAVRGLIPAGRIASPTAVMGAAAVGALSATVAVVGSEEIRRRVALGASRVRAALSGLAAGRRRSLQGARATAPRALPAPAPGTAGQDAPLDP